ncbi:hypothetical protein L2E82_34447 [Cichorium intybus]|uniref:Uncharacterized protein n=1 Tax=Cichorium intybus TaxID=13427 RepID=A0ACB9BM83_CICIN|nr:hypothetical protein L2E82_34447 [Cichorium intybus]
MLRNDLRSIRHGWQERLTIPKHPTWLAGKMDDTSKLTEKEIIRAERNSGIVSGKLREIQKHPTWLAGKMDDTSKLTEKEIIRAERNSGIVNGKLREIQKHPTWLAGKMDDTSKLTEKEIIRAERNSGIVNGKLREIQIQAGLSALEDAIKARFEDFKQIRSDLI